MTYFVNDEACAACSTSRWRQACRDYLLDVVAELVVCQDTLEQGDIFANLCLHVSEKDLAQRKEGCMHMITAECRPPNFEIAAVRSSCTFGKPEPPLQACSVSPLAMRARIELCSVAVVRLVDKTDESSS